MPADPKGAASRGGESAFNEGETHKPEPCFPPPRDDAGGLAKKSHVDGVSV